MLFCKKIQICTETFMSSYKTPFLRKINGVRGGFAAPHTI